MIPFACWVNANTCPKCHHPLSEDYEGVVCMFCHWRPIELAEDADE